MTITAWSGDLGAIDNTFGYNDYLITATRNDVLPATIVDDLTTDGLRAILSGRANASSHGESILSDVAAETIARPGDTLFRLPNGGILMRRSVFVDRCTSTSWPTKEGKGAGAPTANPFAEIMTYPVNDAAIESSLRTVDPALADFYRSVLASSPITTMSDLIHRVAMTNPDALTQAQAAIAAEGRPATEMGERVVFELVAGAAGWSPADASARPALVTHFETAMREERYVEGAETTEAREARERRERDARDRDPRGPVR